MWILSLSLFFFSTFVTKSSCSGFGHDDDNYLCTLLIFIQKVPWYFYVISAKINCLEVNGKQFFFSTYIIFYNENILVSNRIQFQTTFPNTLKRFNLKKKKNFNAKLYPFKLPVCNCYEKCSHVNIKNYYKTHHISAISWGFFCNKHVT